jgi:hypothetical protein
MAVNISVVVIRVVAPRDLAGSYLCFRGIYCLHLQGMKVKVI